MSSRIPLRKTGLLVFGSRIVSIFTGMLFLIMITGWLNPAGFGLWEVILTLVSLASYPGGLLGFWATRDIARGRLKGRTVIILNFALSALAVVAYLVFTSLAYSSFYHQYGPFLFAGLLVPLSYWNQAANSIASGHYPSALGWSLLVSEPGKLVVGYMALYVFRLGIFGVIDAMLASYALQAGVTTLLVSGAVLEKADFGTAKGWIRYGWVPGIMTLPATLASLDTVLASAIGSTNLAGHYQAAFQIGALVSYAMYLSYALYPLLLKGGSDEVPNATLEFILMFGIPMAVGVAILAPQLLTVLSSAYVAAGANVSAALILLGLAGLVTAIFEFLDTTLAGREIADLHLETGLSSYLRTSFAFISKVNLAYASSYVFLVSADVYIGTMAGLSVTDVVTVWALLQLLLLSAAVAVKLRRARRTVKFVMPPSLPKFLFSSAVMAVLAYLLAVYFLTYTPGRLIYGVKTMFVVAAAAAAYFGTLLAIDHRTRALARAFLE